MTMTTEEESTTTLYPPPPPPRPTKSEVQSCQFSTWYSTFRNISKSSLLHTTNNNNDNNATTTTYNNNNTHPQKLRKHVTIESNIIRPLPLEFIEYLLCDGTVRLPKCAQRVSSCMKDDTTTATATAGGTDEDDGWEDNCDKNYDDDDDDDSSSNEDDEEEIKQYNFPQLTHQIQTILQTLGSSNSSSGVLGSCMPKLNWSSPKDATWINCGTLKCTQVGDVYLLLKSSEFVCFDLEKAWYDLEPEETQPAATAAAAAEKDPVGGANNKDNDDNDKHDDDDDDGKPPVDFEYELVLRKWCNLHPSMEFRCFVYDHELIAISQRHPSKFYSHLQVQQQQPSLLSEEDGETTTATATTHPIMTDIIHDFFETYVQHRFAGGKVHRYVIDVYVDSQERTWIVDFNVWGKRTDSLLFDWTELMEIGERVKKSKKKNGDEEEEVLAIPMPEFRVVTKDMKDLTYDPLSSFRGPTDVMNLMGGGGGSSNDDGGFEVSSFKQFMDQCVRPSEM